jgi:hypothetical protein
MEGFAQNRASERALFVGDRKDNSNVSGHNGSFGGDRELAINAAVGCTVDDGKRGSSKRETMWYGGW